jgi:hypothetical protein
MTSVIMFSVFHTPNSYFQNIPISEEAQFTPQTCFFQGHGCALKGNYYSKGEIL